MKQFFILLYSLIISGTSFTFGMTPINEKLVRSFKETFPNAVQVMWTELPEAYLVNFVENGVRSRIVYDKNGNFVSSTRTYLAHDLPYYILISIKKKYPEKRIFGVTELGSGSTTEYYIKMEDSKVWTTIKIDNGGNLELVEKYKKAP
jgi:hypothetical protein